METSPETASLSLFTPARIAAVVLSVLAIALVAAVLKAQPGPNQRRAEAALISDGRMLGNAAQQYFLTTGKTVAHVGYDPASGAISGDLTPWLSHIQKQLKVSEMPIESFEMNAFSLAKPEEFREATVWFTDEGRVTPNKLRQQYEKVREFFRGI